MKALGSGIYAYIISYVLGFQNVLHLSNFFECENNHMNKLHVCHFVFSKTEILSVISAQNCLWLNPSSATANG